MKTKLRGITLTALLLSASNMTFADQGVVSDLPGFGEEAYFAEEATYAENAEIKAVSHAGPSALAQAYVGSEDHSDFSPVRVGDLQESASVLGSGLQQVGHHAADCCDVGCDSGCDGGCDSACGSSCDGNRFSNLLTEVEDVWATTELLLWFVQDRDMPPIITTAAPGNAPILGLPGVNTVFGDDISGELSAGIRADVGKYVNDCVGIGGRFVALATNNDSYYAASDGTDMSIGRSFFNTNTNAQDAVIISSAGNFTGEIAANDSVELWGAEGYARLRFGCNKNAKLELIGGYSHYVLNNNTYISSTTVTNATGRIRNYIDDISTKNTFDGGQVGFEMSMTRGRWSARSLTKVHLGNMRQRFLLLGSAVDVTPPAAPTNTQGGVFTLDNQALLERDVFAFIPEANFKLAYQVCDHAKFTVGYTFMYFDNVALTGDFIDNNVDGTALNTNNVLTRPAFAANDSGLWIQGIDLGFIMEF